MSRRNYNEAYNNGDVRIIRRDNCREYMRGGRLCRTYTKDEDDLITRRRIDGMNCEQIAREANAIFGRDRTARSIHQRLVMLASVE